MEFRYKEIHIKISDYIASIVIATPHIEALRTLIFNNLT